MSDAPLTLDGIKMAASADAIDEMSAERLVASLRHDDADVRCAALRAIWSVHHRGGYAFSPDAALRCASLAEDPDPFVRAEVASSLAILPDPAPQNSRAVLIRLLQDPSPVVRREAAAALGDRLDMDAKRVLVRGLEDADDYTRFECAFALASMKDDNGLSLLLLALGDKTLRLDACEALRRLHSAEAVEPLWELAKRRFLGWPERLVAWATLYSLGESKAGTLVASRLSAFSREERRLAIGLIESHRILEAKDALWPLAANPRHSLHAEAVAALRALDAAESAPKCANSPTHRAR